MALEGAELERLEEDEGVVRSSDYLEVMLVTLRKVKREG
jgi:hypothetical protein